MRRPVQMPNSINHHWDFLLLCSINAAPRCRQRGPELRLSARATNSAREFACRRDRKELAIKTQHAGKQKSRPTASPAVSRREAPGRRHGETSAANTCQSDRESNEESNQVMHHCPVPEKVWMPHSNFLPPQRPERGFFGSSGIAVQGSQPMLR